MTVIALSGDGLGEALGLLRVEVGDAESNVARGQIRPKLPDSTWADNSKCRQSCRSRNFSSLRARTISRAL